MKHYPIRTKYYDESGVTGIVSHVQWARAVVKATDEYLKAAEPKPCPLCLGDGCPDCIDGFDWPILTATDKAQIHAAARKALEGNQ